MINEFNLKVSDIKDETSDAISLYFEKPKDFAYNSGDCIDIMLSDRKLGKKTFSFASSPLESELFITYKKGISLYKKLLKSLRVGDIIECTHYGSNFVYHPGKKSIFIAGGVGVTPLRSMIYTSLHERAKEDMFLIYLNNSDSFVFYNEFRKWEKANNNLNCIFINTVKMGKISKEMLLQHIPHIENNLFDFYISGPPLMVDLTTQIIDSLGLTNHIIHTDSFDGYTKELE